MKRILILFLFLALLFSCLSACYTSGGTGTDTESSDSSASVSGSSSVDTDMPVTAEPSQMLPTDPVQTIDPAQKEPIILYTLNDSDAGSIEGKTHQNGKSPTTSVKAVANFGYRFVAWSDGVTTAVRGGDTASEPTTLVAIFDYDQKELPVIAITTDSGGNVASKTHYEGGTIAILGAGDYDMAPMTMQIRGRGNSTWTFEKKPYKVKLSKKENLLGIADGQYRDYVLVANHCDHSLLRNDIGLEMGDIFTALPFVPGAISVDLYLNGRYDGVYLLAESIETGKGRVDVDTSGVNTDVDTGYLFKVDTYAEPADFMVDGKKYALKSDLSTDRALAAEQRQFISGYTNQCYNILKGGDEERVRAFIDVPSLVDAYIYEEYLKNLDMGFDSFYLCKPAGGKLTFGPCWDFDLTLGNGNEGCERYEDLYCGILYQHWLSNSWFIAANAHEWFRTLVQQRWNQLYPSIEKIPARILEKGSKAQNALDRNFIRYPIFGQCINRETEAILSLHSNAEQVAYLANWAKNRGQWLNVCYTSNDYILGRYTPQATQTLRYGNQAAKTLSARTPLTSYLDPSQRQSTISSQNGHSSSYFIDGSLSTYLEVTVSGGKRYELSFPIRYEGKISGYTIVTHDTKTSPDAWSLYGSLDGVTWFLLDERENQSLTPAFLYGYEITPRHCKYLKFVTEAPGVLRLTELTPYAQT